MRRPALIDTPVNNLHRNIGLACPFTNVFGFTIDGNWMVITFIVVLFCWSFPATVLSRVVSIIIDSSKGSSSGSYSHVSQEAFKTFPRFWVTDSSTSIVRVARIIEVTTATLHSFPTLERWSSSHSMGCVGLTSQVGTTAAFGSSLHKLPTVDQSSLTTSTLTEHING